MITQETLEKFLYNKKEIIQLCEQIGMTNIRLILPGMPEHKDTVLLLVDRQGEFDMIDKERVGKKIVELIQCPVRILTEPEIHKLLKEEMLKNPVSIENNEAIEQRFINHLIPFSLNPEEDPPEKTPVQWLISSMPFIHKTREDSPPQKAKKQKLDKIRELMEDVQEAIPGSEEKVIVDWVVKNVNHKILISKVTQDIDSQAKEEPAELVAQRPSIEIK